VTTPVQSPLPAKDVALFFVLATITIIPIFYFDVLPLHDLPGFDLSGIIPISKLLADESCTQISDGDILVSR